jgi:hypothetical protein
MQQRPSGRRVSDEDVRAAVPSAKNMRHLLELLELAPYGGNYETMRSRLERLGLDHPRFRRRPRLVTWRSVPVEELVRVVALSDSHAQAARMLGFGTSTAAQRHAKRLTEAAGLDTGHYLGKTSNRGLRRGGRAAEPLPTLLVQGRRLHTSNLRERLLAEGLLLPECSCCGNDRWRGAPIPLELDHVNGDRADNRFENLRLLCPNCHAQTSTYRGRNIGSPVVRERLTSPVPDPSGAHRLQLILSPCSAAS